MKLRNFLLSNIAIFSVVAVSSTWGKQPGAGMLAGAAAGAAGGSMRAAGVLGRGCPATWPEPPRERGLWAGVQG